MELDEALCDLHPLLGYICVHIGSPSRVCWFSAEHWRTYDVQSPADTNTALRHVAEKLLTETRGLAKTNKSEGLVFLLLYRPDASRIYGNFESNYFSSK